VPDGFRVNHELTETLHLVHEAFPLALAATRRPGGDLLVRARFGGSDAEDSEEELVVAALSVGEDEAAAEVGGARLRASFSSYATAAEWVLDLWPRDGAAAGAHHQFRRPLARAWASAAGAGAADSAAGAAAAAGAARAPMPGRVAKVLVARGQAVAKGEALCAVEAMKMEHAVRRAFSNKKICARASVVRLRSYTPHHVTPPQVLAPRAGVVAELPAAEGAQVDEGDVLAVVAPAGAAGGEGSEAGGAAPAGGSEAEA
jgi:biotin carboxyl carrier protein